MKKLKLFAPFNAKLFFLKLNYINSELTTTFAKVRSYAYCVTVHS